LIIAAYCAKSTSVILFFSFTGRKENDKSIIATMKKSSNSAGTTENMSWSIVNWHYYDDLVFSNLPVFLFPDLHFSIG
jgi:hypothetical protein